VARENRPLAFESAREVSTQPVSERTSSGLLYCIREVADGIAFDCSVGNERPIAGDDDAAVVQDERRRLLWRDEFSQASSTGVRASCRNRQWHAVVVQPSKEADPALPRFSRRRIVCVADQRTV